MADQAQPACIRHASAGIQGLSPYQPGKPVSEIEREYGLSDIIKLASNESPLGPAPGALVAARESLAGVAQYPDGNGFELKRALARRHGVAPEQVVLGNGSNDVLDLAARVFLGPGRNAVFSQHGFAVYMLVTRAVDAEAREVPALGLDSAMPCGHDLNAMAGQVDARTGVVFVANPNNPTGTWAESGALRALLDSVSPGTLVVLDEAYAEYVEAPDYPDATRWLDNYPNLLVTRTFSKAFGLAGLRIGYGLCHPAVADLMNRVRQPFNANVVAQAAALAALDDRDHLARAVAVNSEGLRMLGAGFDRLGLRWLPSVANFISVQVPDAPAVYEALLQAGIIVRPVEAYGLPGFLRVSIGLSEHNQRLLAELEKVVQA